MMFSKWSLRSLDVSNLPSRPSGHDARMYLVAGVVARGNRLAELVLAKRVTKAGVWMALEL
jgi:hypothetical protein